MSEGFSRDAGAVRNNEDGAGRCGVELLVWHKNYASKGINIKERIPVVSHIINAFDALDISKHIPMPQNLCDSYMKMGWTAGLVARLTPKCSTSTSNFLNIHPVQDTATVIFIYF